MNIKITRRGFLKLSLTALSLSVCRSIIHSPVRTDIFSLSTPADNDLLTPNEIPVTRDPTELSVSSTQQEIPTQNPTNTATSTPISPEINMIVDGHQDIAWNMLEFGRNPRASALDTREKETSSGLSDQIGLRTSGFPEWINGDIGIIFSTLFVMPDQYAYSGWHKITYQTPKQAEVLAREQLKYYADLSDQFKRIKLILSCSDLYKVVQSWREGLTRENRIVGFIPLMEGADPIISPGDLENWYTAGLHIIGPAWRTTRYAAGTGDPGPLSPLGYELLNAMAEFKMVLDVSHLAEKAFYQSVEAYRGPVIASHSNPREFIPTDRGLSDDMILELADRNSVIGIVLYNKYLDPEWEVGMPKDYVSVNQLVKVIDYVVQLTGSSRYVAIGSDLDGGFGAESIPAEINTTADFPKIAEALGNYGYGRADIAAILHGNWVRILEECLPT
jgi:membrane dipeptidase